MAIDYNEDLAFVFANFFRDAKYEDLSEKHTEKIKQQVIDFLGCAMAGYNYTATETIDGIARGYAGVSEKKLNAAVWACDGTSYALLAEEGLDAWAMRQLAESVK